MNSYFYLENVDMEKSHVLAEQKVQDVIPAQPKAQGVPTDQQNCHLSPTHAYYHQPKQQLMFATLSATQ
jgi:hypothetical protein